MSERLSAEQVEEIRGRRTWNYCAAILPKINSEELQALCAECVYLRQERDAAILLLEEREQTMHIRIRGEYDKTVADCWKIAIAKVEAERDAALSEIGPLAQKWGRTEFERDQARQDVAVLREALENIAEPLGSTNDGMRRAIIEDVQATARAALAQCVQIFREQRLERLDELVETIRDA